MLKFGVLLLTILHLSLSAPPAAAPPKATLTDTLIHAFPLDQIKELSKKHLESDPSYVAAINAMKSDKFKALLQAVRSDPNWITYKKFLNESGLDLDRIIKHMEHCLNNTDTSKLTPAADTKPSFANFIKDVKGQILAPFIKSLASLGEKMGKDEDLMNKFATITSTKSKELLEKSFAQPAMKNLAAEYKNIGVDVEAVLSTLYIFSGWTQTTPKTA